MQGKQSPLCQGRDTEGCWNRGVIPRPVQSKSAKIVTKALQRYWESHTSYLSPPFCSQKICFSHVCYLKCLTYINCSCSTKVWGARYGSKCAGSPIWTLRAVTTAHLSTSMCSINLPWKLSLGQQRVSLTLSHIC